MTHAAEAGPDRSDKLKKAVALLNGKDSVASLEARNQLFEAPFKELKPLLPGVIKVVRDGSRDRDHAAQILSLLGPDCGELLPVFIKEIRAEKNATRRRALVVLIARLGASARKGLRELQIMQRDDRDRDVRLLVARTIKRIDYSADKAAEALRLLKLKKYASIKEHRAAWTAKEDVLKHSGINVELIQQLTRWTLQRACRRNPPAASETSGLFEYGPGALRVAMPVIRNAIEGKNVKMRAAGFSLLAGAVRLPHFSAWPACNMLAKFLESPTPAVRRETAIMLADIRKRIPDSWLPTHPIETVVPKLRKAWFKDKDLSVCEACCKALEVFKSKKAGLRKKSAESKPALAPAKGPRPKK
jgi:hypothetical protein